MTTHKTCESCGTELRIDNPACGGGWEFRSDLVIRDSMHNEAPRYLITTVHGYCARCAPTAPQGRETRYTAADAEDAKCLSPIYERLGLGPLHEGDPIGG